MSAKPLIDITTGKPLKTAVRQISPGTWEPCDLVPDDAPRYAVVKLMRQGDGSVIPVLNLFGQYRRVAGLADALGIRGLSQRTLERLVETSFVESIRPAPAVTLVDMASLCRHLEATRDPEFWTDRRRAQYRSGWKRNEK